MADEKTQGRESVVATKPQRHARLALTLPSPASGRGEKRKRERRKARAGEGKSGRTPNQSPPPRRRQIAYIQEDDPIHNPNTSPTAILRPAGATGDSANGRDPGRH